MGLDNCYVVCYGKLVNYVQGMDRTFLEKCDVVVLIISVSEDISKVFSMLKVVISRLLLIVGLFIVGVIKES